MPATPSQPAAVASGRKPTSSAIAVTAAVVSSVRATLAPTCPLSTAPRLTAIVRNRSMMPPVMSVHTLMDVVEVPAATVIMRMPGTRKSTYGAPCAAAPIPPPIGPPRT